MPRITLLICLATIVLTGNRFAQAQSNAMTEMYGVAVHRYYSGDYLNADTMLSQVIASGSQDPRAHYFRGLCQEKQGADGLHDFQAGARLEAEGRRAIGIGRALTRIQGRLRGKIENARRDARAQVRQEQLSQKMMRENTVPSVMPGTVPPTPEVTSDPFSNGEGVASAEKSAAPEVKASDPFADDAVTTPAPAPAATTPAAPVADAASPFDPPADTGGDIFGSPAPAAEPATPDAGNVEDPFSGDAGDIFGN